MRYFFVCLLISFSICPVGSGFSQNIIEANKIAHTVISPLSLEIHELHVTKGQEIKKGDLLLSFNCLALEKKIVQYLDKKNHLEQIYLKKLELESLGFESKVAVDDARDSFEKVDGKYHHLLDISHQCDVLSPIDGEVSEIAFTLPFKPLKNQVLLILEAKSDK